MCPLRLACAISLLFAATSAAPAAQIKIACIGDSITQGSGLSNPNTESYPAKLGRLMGTNYVVRNFGVSARTLLRQGDFPYWKEAVFKTSHDWQPDVVIIQLGANDSKPYNWRHGTNFVSDYEDLVASYASLTNRPRVVVCTPCPVYNKGAFDISPVVVATQITPKIYDIASRLRLDLIDLQTRLAGHPEWFPDTVHPNSKGMTVMAAVMYAGLRGISNVPRDEEVWLERVAANRAVLRWPADSRTMVPLVTTAFRGTNTAWTVSESVIYLDGEEVRQTNSASGAPKFYRLWLP